MSKRKSRKKSRSETIFQVMLGLVAASMVVSLILVALPVRPAPTPTPLPTWTPRPIPSIPPTPSPEPSPSPLPTLEPTEPAMGPVLPTETPTVTPTLTTTPASAGREFRFAVAGDSRDNPQVYRRLLEAVMADGNEFLIHTGDLVNKGTDQQWQAFEKVMADFTLPFYPVPGNHDGLDGELDGFLAHSGAPAAHYSFDRYPIHFTLADSHNGGISAAELTWLRTDLSATDQPIKMVFLHHPPFDPDGTDHIMAYGSGAFLALMAEMAVDYVFAGHIHAYTQEVRAGVAYYITGGAGAPLYSQNHPQAFHHYLQVSVHDGQVTVEVVKV